MKKIIVMFLLAYSGLLCAQNKKFATTRGEIAVFEKVMSSSERDALVAPYVGYLIFNTTTKCHEFWDGAGWYNYCTNSNGISSPSSGGSAVVSSYECSTGFSGTMTVGIPVSNVTQIITANVTTLGTYNISTTANGVTFIGSGGFVGTGLQNIVLTAVGTPTAVGDHTFALSTTPGCSFSRTTGAASSATSGGSAIVSSYNCSGTDAGTMTVGTAVSGVTRTITADVTTMGTYNISATANGVTFTGTGAFAGTGLQNIVLTATGTPIAEGSNTFALSTTPNCSFDRTTGAAVSASSGGTAIVTAYSCSTASAGTMTAGTAVSGVTQTITATVSKLGTYSITTSANGVTFAGSGTFVGIGSQDIVLTATGTPVAEGSNSFALSTTPNCSFDRTTDAAVSATSGGTGIVSAYNCSTASAGTMTVGTAVSGVTQTITATVTKAGTYSITTTANGVTFAGSGSFVGIGAQDIVLTATGTPTLAGTPSFALSTTPGCSFSRTINANVLIASLDCAGASTTGSLTENAAASGVSTSIAYTGGNGAPYASQAVPSAGVTGLTATLAAGTLANGNGSLVYSISGTPTGNGTASFAVSIGGQSCTFAVNVNMAIVIPATITLAQNQTYLIASVYDQDYLPYTAPTGSGSLGAKAADGANEATTVDVQGTISTTGITVSIPATATGSGTLPAYTATINIPASMAQDGVSRNVTLSWDSQAYTSSTKVITATLKAVGGTYNAPKLDINNGIGNDGLGVLLGKFAYPYNSSGATTNYSLNGTPGIPNRMFGVADATGSTTTHRMLYLPIVSPTGKIWLNNNLGADYANIDKPSFNIAQQATASNDYKAYGSMFQWGRRADGHELINWTSATDGSGVNGLTTIPSTTDTPNHALFVGNNLTPQDWRSPQNNNLWQGVSGINNPCPSGFRLANDAEWRAEVSANGISNLATAYSSVLKLTGSGARSRSNGIVSSTGNAYYWTSYSNGEFSYYWYGSGSNAIIDWHHRQMGFAVRCIKD